MTAKSIKAGVKTLLTNNVNLEENGYQVLEYYPRTINNSKGKVVVIWVRRGKEERFAGSGRSLGPVQGVKRIPWLVQTSIIAWGTAVDLEYPVFEDLVDRILETYRKNNTFGDYQAPEGSQVLNFGETQEIDNIEPHYVGQFLRYQTVITTTCEEIENA